MEIKVSDELNGIINYSRDEAMRTGSYGIGPDHLFLGIIAAVAGIFFVVKHFSSKKSIESDRQSIIQDYDDLSKNSIVILRAIMAEIVDFIAEFNQKDAKAAHVVEYLEQISPEQYVRKLSGTRRHVRTNV